MLIKPNFKICMSSCAKLSILCIALLSGCLLLISRGSSATATLDFFIGQAPRMAAPILVVIACFAMLYGMAYLPRPRIYEEGIHYIKNFSACEHLSWREISAIAWQSWIGLSIFNRSGNAALHLYFVRPEDIKAIVSRWRNELATEPAPRPVLPQEEALPIKPAPLICAKHYLQVALGLVAFLSVFLGIYFLDGGDDPEFLNMLKTFFIVGMAAITATFVLRYTLHLLVRMKVTNGGMRAHRWGFKKISIDWQEIGLIGYDRLNRLVIFGTDLRPICSLGFVDKKGYRQLLQRWVCVPQQP